MVLPWCYCVWGFCQMWVECASPSWVMLAEPWVTKLVVAVSFFTTTFCFYTGCTSLTRSHLVSLSLHKGGWKLVISDLLLAYLSILHASFLLGLLSLPQLTTNLLIKCSYTPLSSLYYFCFPRSSQTPSTHFSFSLLLASSFSLSSQSKNSFYTPWWYSSQSCLPSTFNLYLSPCIIFSAFECLTTHQINSRSIVVCSQLHCFLVL